MSSDKEEFSSASAAAAAAAGVASMSLHASAEACESDEEGPAPRRVFTAEEQAARLIAQREEEDAYKKEEAALRDEQKALCAQIVKRRVGFGSSVSSGPSSGVAALGQDDSDYTQHDSRRKLAMLFVGNAATCALVAPLALAFLRQKHAHVLVGSIACSEGDSNTQANPLLDTLLGSNGLPTSKDAAGSASAAAVLPLAQALRLPGARPAHCIISLDDSSRAAADDAAAGTPSHRFHQPMPALSDSATAEDAEPIVARVKEFISDLPDLLTML